MPCNEHTDVNAKRKTWRKYVQTTLQQHKTQHNNNNNNRVNVKWMLAMEFNFEFIFSA